MVFVIDKVRNFCNLRDFFVFFMENIGYNEVKKREEEIDCFNEGNKRRLCLLIYYFFFFFGVY